MRFRFWLVLFSIVAFCSAIGIIVAKTFPDQEPPTAPLANNIGKAVYDLRCAPCHGVDGKGNGPNAFFLEPRPADFSTGVFRYRSTESGSLPTDEDLTHTIRNGLPGTAMPAWGNLIHGDTLLAVIDHVKSFSPRFKSERPKAVQVRSVPPSTPASIAAGERLYAKMECSACHGTDGKGTDRVTSDFEDDNGNPIVAADLTKPWTFHGGSTVRDVFLRFRTGIDGTPMPSYVGSASDKDLWDLANYVVSMARKPIWQMSADEIKATYEREQSAANDEPASRGEYLVATLGCAHCHTPVDDNGRYMPGLKFAGGQAWNVGPYGWLFSYNLTSDSATGLGKWTDDQIKAAITHGIRRDGSHMLPFPMPWTSFAHLSQSDLNGIVAYLRRIPPVRNATLNPQPLGFFSYLTAKFKMLILGKELVVYSYPGNAGSAALTSRNETAGGQGAGK